jgi:hypothetical protein
MTILPSLRALVTKDVASFLSDNQKIKDIVEEAAGENPYVEWTHPTSPFGKQISEILEGLEGKNADRWLLTYILVAAVEDNELDELRKLIVRACPETLIITSKFEQQVERVLTVLQKLLTQPLAPNVLEFFRLNQARLQIVVQDTARLFAYKSLHESLHALQSKLTVGEALGAVLGEDTEAHAAISIARAQAEQATALLAVSSADESAELTWIAALKPLGEELKAAAAAADHSLERDLIEQVRYLIRSHLLRLDRRVFEAARRLSLSAIVENPPYDLKDRPEFIELNYAIRDLKPTVLARALKHRMWQDAEKELFLIDALLDVPGPATADTVHEWFRFKSRILWLAALDPDAGWSADAQTLADQISDAMAAAEKRDSIKAYRTKYSKLIAVCFFAIDAMLKTDCTTLRKVDGPLNAILKELQSV